MHLVHAQGLVPTFLAPAAATIVLAKRSTSTFFAQTLRLAVWAVALAAAFPTHPPVAAVLADG